MAAPIAACVAAWEADALVRHDPHFPPPTAGSLDWPCLHQPGCEHCAQGMQGSSV